MLRLFAATLTGSLGWMSLFMQMAMAQSFPQIQNESEFIQETELPFCYMQTPDGGLMDLTQYCGNGRRQPSSLAATPSAEPVPAIILPTAPGGRACVIFDDEGRPCVANR